MDVVEDFMDKGWSINGIQEEEENNEKNIY